MSVCVSNLICTSIVSGGEAIPQFINKLMKLLHLITTLRLWRAGDEPNYTICVPLNIWNDKITGKPMWCSPLIWCNCWMQLIVDSQRDCSDCVWCERQQYSTVAQSTLVAWHYQECSFEIKLWTKKNEVVDRAPLKTICTIDHCQNSIVVFSTVNVLKCWIQRKLPTQKDMRKLRSV